ncbi:MAG TPA: acyl-CoA thioesterase [Sphingomonadaceae bacterium]|nr:acyl-CoA thioesterase [Sphingomonadaceae bacterium]
MTDTMPTPADGPHLRTVAMPRDTNPSGAIFGGWTLSQMDLAGAIVAAERAGGRVVTVSVDAMKFLRPIAVGDEVSCFATIEEEHPHSVAVRIETWARTRGTGGEAEKVTQGVYTYVALGEDGKPRRIGPER